MADRINDEDARAVQEIYDRRWPLRKTAALKLLIETDETYVEIARRVGIQLRTLRNWVDDPVFYGKMKEARERIVQAVVKKGIRDKSNRLNLLQNRHDALMHIVERRKAMAEDHLGAPGFETGWLTYKPTPNGRKYEVDNHTLRMLLDMEKQAAIEMGDWQTTQTLDININDRKLDEGVAQMIERLYNAKPDPLLLIEGDIIDVTQEEE